MSTRETKKLATEWTSSASPASLRRSMPRMYASAIAVYASTEKSSVTLTLIPSAIACSIAGTPSSVPGILTNRFGRSTRFQRSRAWFSVPSVSCASDGSTSSETKPSLPPVDSCTPASTSAASWTSLIASSS